MIDLKLIRIAEDRAAMMGVLCLNNQPIFVTLERPWLNNKKNISCIPVGFYKCHRKVSDHFGLVLEVQEVPNRTDILFHAGNVVKDTHGCILIGMQYGELNGLPAVLNAQSANKIMREKIITSSEYTLKILDAR